MQRTAVLVQIYLETTNVGYRFPLISRQPPLIHQDIEIKSTIHFLLVYAIQQDKFPWFLLLTGIFFNFITRNY
jgi:hypothetical protein